jgi:hypothetical protein
MTARAVFGSIVGVGLLIVLSAIFNGYALSVLWGWFVVPTFGGPALGIVPAIGIAMVVGYLTHQSHDCKKEDDELRMRFTKQVVGALLKPAFALFFGWIVHLVM